MVLSNKEALRTFFRSAPLALLATTWLTGCSLDDKNSALFDPGYWWGYADLRMPGGDGREFDLLLDNGTVLDPVSFMAPVPSDYQLWDGMRVVANFSKYGEEYLLDGVTHWPVRLNGMMRVLTKLPVADPALGETDNDPIELRRMWLSSKYLNATFNFRFSDPQIVHTINLWVNTAHPQADAQNVYVELRHNAHGNGMGLKAFGRASFDISGLLAEGQNSITVHFSYTDYSGQTYTFTKPYSRNINEEPGDLTLDPGSDDAASIE